MNHDDSLNVIRFEPSDSGALFELSRIMPELQRFSNDWSFPIKARLETRRATCTVHPATAMVATYQIGMATALADLEKACRVKKVAVKLEFSIVEAAVEAEPDSPARAKRMVNRFESAIKNEMFNEGRVTSEQDSQTDDMSRMTPRQILELL